MRIHAGLLLLATVAAGCLGDDATPPVVGAPAPYAGRVEGNTTVSAACADAAGGCIRSGGALPGVQYDVGFLKEGQFTLLLSAEWDATTPATESLLFQFRQDGQDVLSIESASPLHENIVLEAGKYGFFIRPVEEPGAIVSQSVHWVIEGDIREREL